MRRMIWLWIALAVLIVSVAAVLGIGAAVEREHVATVRGVYDASPQDLWAAITEFERMAEWRDGIDRVEILEPSGGKRRIREHGKFGPMTYVVEEERPPSKLVLRIADEDKGFGGTWTYEIRESAGGSELAITERGFIDNLLFRFMARFVFGYEATMRGYHASLAAKLGG